jgi:hypothetical protein
MSNGRRGLVVVLVSSAAGVAYFASLTVVPCPPEIVKLVPLVWFTACLAGWVWSTLADDGRLISIAALALNVPNTMFAAMMGG